MAIIFANASFRTVRGTRWDDDVQVVDKDTLAPVDLTGITGIVMRLRKTIGSPILMELSTVAGTLVIVDAALGKVGIRVDSLKSRTDFPENNHVKAKYLYDAIIERTPGEYEAAITGKVTVLPQITRPWAAT